MTEIVIGDLSLLRGSNVREVHDGQEYFSFEEGIHLELVHIRK